MSIVGLYLHDYRYSSPIDNVAGVQIDIFINQLDDSSQLKQIMSEASHIIGHFRGEGFNMLLDEQESPPTMSSFQVVFCLTTDGAGFGRDDHKKVNCTNGTTRYIFYVNHVDDIRRDEVLKAFYSMNEKQAQALLDCDYVRVPQAILSLFNLKIEALSAISILCQGYLATNSKSENDTVKNALTKMGWNLQNHPDISSKKTDAQQTSWWLEPFNNVSIDKIMEKSKNEWDERNHGKIPKSVIDLLESFRQKTLQDSVIVANAYIAICDRLTEN